MSSNNTLRQIHRGRLRLSEWYGCLHSKNDNKWMMQFSNSKKQGLLNCLKICRNNDALFLKELLPKMSNNVEETQESCSLISKHGLNHCFKTGTGILLKVCHLIQLQISSSYRVASVQLIVVTCMQLQLLVFSCQASVLYALLVLLFIVLLREFFSFHHHFSYSS